MIRTENTKDSWDEMIDLMYEFNISIGDIFHVTMARDQGCNVFVTKDSAFAEMVEQITGMMADTPSEINEKMKKKGILPFWE
jgi:predicted nucleic acid-binding protein